MEKNLTVKGANVHNLKNVNVEIPRDKLVVFTGLSGSGKSSLAFDTIYAEGQRRYMESLSSYARQFLGQMDKPDVESIDGLSPAISIDQKTTSKNPRSTVGTVTEIYDYLRLLYARVGVPHCPVCGKEIKTQTIDQIVDKVMELEDGTKFQVLAPIAKGKKGEFKKELEQASKSGYVRARIDGIIYDLSEDIKLEKNIKHNIEIIVDRLVMKRDIASRLADSLETAFSLTEGTVLIAVVDGEEFLYSQNFACPEHGSFMDELEPRMFSFNNPFGACPTCSGLSMFLRVSEDLLVPNRNLSISEGAIKGCGWGQSDRSTIAGMYYTALAEKYNFTFDTPFKDISKAGQDAIFYGTKGERIQVTRVNEYGSGTYMTEFEGIVNNLERRHRETTSDWSRNEIEQYMTESPCPACKGKRLKPASLAVTVGGKNIMEFTDMSVREELEFIEKVQETLSEKDKKIGKQIFKEIRSRLSFLCDVGLDYLTLSRSAGTLSGGESQRIRLATQIGSSLMGVLYILDEPSIGLHQRDNDKLLQSLKNLRDLGNTLIVVEHDEDTMNTADYIVDVGPGAGVHGGQIVFQGTVKDIKKCKESITGQYLSGKRKIETPVARRAGNGKALIIKGASENNLKNIDVEIPLGKFVAVTGVSGSGKSSLINEILFKKLAAELNGARKFPGKHKEISGLEHLDKVIDIDQSPIGRTPRSNPATYTGVFTDIRELFAQTQDAKMKGYSAGRFSFNVKGGRCEACEGDGIIKIEMNFLSDVYVPCEVCHGARYNRETLEVLYKGKSISDVLNMTVEEATEFFKNHPKIHRKLETLNDVGLGYITLGQPATTLSGGEAQRVKLATELSKRSTGRTIYILDEPTTGLHTADVSKLLEVLNRLVDGENSIVVIEHNLDVIKTADYIIDLGPEGGNGGGTVVATGTPEEVAKNKKSYTGQYLKSVLSK
ncbi:MAG: excinuclease ABC subunit UvrA [Ruminococcaceae bacterium]|nr:excinuclease ABC subunit UvrA [Oscillospiraceae bacterium]